jgi:hypothetical protein
MNASTQTAVGAYTAKAIQIIGMIEDMQVYADGLHDIDPESVHWGNVSDLERIASMLREIKNIIKK